MPPAGRRIASSAASPPCRCRNRALTEPIRRRPLGVPTRSRALRPHRRQRTRRPHPSRGVSTPTCCRRPATRNEPAKLRRYRSIGGDRARSERMPGQGQCNRPWSTVRNTPVPFDIAEPVPTAWERSVSPLPRLPPANLSNMRRWCRPWIKLRQRSSRAVLINGTQVGDSVDVLNGLVSRHRSRRASAGSVVCPSCAAKRCSPWSGG